MSNSFQGVHAMRARHGGSWVRVVGSGCVERRPRRAVLSVILWVCAIYPGSEAFAAENVTGGAAAARIDATAYEIASLIEDLQPGADGSRVIASGRLGHYGPKAIAALEPLVECLRDDDFLVRANAARALGRIGPEGGKRAIRALVSALSDDEERVRWTAAQALSRTGPPAREATTALVEQLSKESSRSVQRHFKTAIVSLNASDREALSQLIEEHDLHTLERLEVNWDGIGDTEFANMIALFPDVKTLAVAPGVTSAGFAQVARLEHLESLNLNRARLQTADMKVVASLPSLRRVALPIGLTDEGFAILAAHPKLADSLASFKRVTFRVVDHEGQPLRNAPASVRRGRNGHRYFTDEHGEFTALVVLGKDPRRNYVQATAATVGSVSLRRTWAGEQVNAMDREYTLTLEKGSFLGGIVRNEDGAAVEGAKVEVSVPSKTDGISYNIQPARTNAEGKWWIDNAPEEFQDVYLRLSHPDYLSSRGYNTIPVPPTELLRAGTAVMVLKRGGDLTGVVRDDAGKPMENALVHLGTDRWNAQSTRTEASGKFHFKNASNDSLSLCVQAPGKSPEIRRVSLEEIASPVAFELKPARRLEILVADAQGQPLADVHVSTENYNGLRYILAFDPGDGASSTRTDEKGLLVWESAPQDAVVFSFSKEGYARLSKSLASGDGRETVTLPRELTVKGVVVDKESGKALEKFVVVPVLDWLNGSPPYVNRREAFDGGAGSFEHSQGRTDTGHYVQIEAPGYLPSRSEMFRVGDGDELSLRFELVRGEDIEGVVKDAGGKPISGATVALATASENIHLANGRFQSRRQPFDATTGEDGRFSLPPRAEEVLVIVADDRGFARVTGESIRRSKEITLVPWGRISGTIVQDGKPVANHKVHVSPIQFYDPAKPVFSPCYNTTTDGEGKFALERVAPGKYTVAGDLGPWRESNLTSSQYVPVVVRAGEETRVESGNTGKTVIGRAVLKDGIERKMRWSYGINYLVAKRPGIEPLPEVQGRAEEWREGWKEDWLGSHEGRAYFQSLNSYFVKLKPDGSFRIHGVPEGDYKLALRIFDPPDGGG